MKKTSFYITIIVFLFAFSSAANASGFIFKWEPFRVDKDLFFVNQEKNSVIDDMTVPDLKAAVPEEKFIDVFDLSTEQNIAAKQKTGEKSFLDSIKIKISPADSTADQQNIYSDQNEEQISKFIDAMTTLIYNDKKIESLETIGKIVEPQIHFYFEF